MAVLYPMDLLADFPGWSTQFELFWRQEQSRQANGRTIVKDFGSPLWIATYQSRQLRINEMDRWRARLDLLENGLNTFKGYSLSRCRPIKHPGTAALPTGTVASISPDRKTITLSGLTSINFQVGDMICIANRDLHRIVDIQGVTYEVRPHLWPAAGVADSVTVNKPHCIMSVVPGSVQTQVDSSTGRGSVSFQAIEAR